ncbi:MAG: Fis family transcriptional regulator [Alphaproteobacteria bacterium]|nr:Fis family transcriptional regulator [Alphaproteobacteria bacterium]
MTKSTNPHIGSSFDDFLREENILEQVNAVAIKRVLAWQVGRGMARRKIGKAAMARRMRTSRAALDRLLDPDNPSVTLLTLDRAATAIGKRLKITLVDKAI